MEYVLVGGDAVALDNAHAIRVESVLKCDRNVSYDGEQTGNVIL
jgi:hypothetical protein